MVCRTGTWGLAAKNSHHLPAACALQPPNRLRSQIVAGGHHVPFSPSLSFSRITPPASICPTVTAAATLPRRVIPS
ncbi:hypothetical protein VFPBJ_06149 [Purpureocillium lilacinum]|uniref:Uncharacterized protein n=1 Tax=Purpureocillium lilacinum TaxID=33203 RepID=A0A179GRQ5_PURLI|nr:hypothetical protein VFPBJ_06149 [Purpureocillium lilacinum]